MSSSFPPRAAGAPFPALLAALEAAGEPTRLRLLALLAEAELTVSELVTILGQSQPRVSRHLKLLVEAGLVDRHREGAWAFFRLAEAAPLAGLARTALAAIDGADATLAADRARLAEVRAARADSAARYFAAHAADWARLRALHVPEARVEAALDAMIGPGPFHALLDLGAGSGRMLELFAGRAGRAVGVDQSPAMLAVARAHLERAGLRGVQLRQGDLYALPVERDGYDVVIIHQVLHYLDDPARALREAARALRPGGRLLVVDFAPHGLEALRDEHAHRRLGFAPQEIAEAMAEAGLAPARHQDVVPREGEASKLVVSIWMGVDRRIMADAPPAARQEVA
ncbi:MAG: metalloregulator ArsR/SmtB family transcription factor [Methylobacteriaceae bacterium]|nr:metalloregulator ArsR/SmtB family transcription factor [Methylobacteriaceae bacterium]